MNDSRVMAVAMAMFVLVFGVVLVCVDDAAEGAVGDTFAVTDEHGNNIGYVITVDDDTSKEVHVKLTDEMEANIVTIPETVSYDDVQYTVTGVDYFRYSTVGTLTLPDTIKTIGYDAFWGTEFSGNLIIPGSVTSIEAYAFEDIEVTGNMSIGEPVPGETLSIASDAFYGASITGTLSLPAGVGSLEDCDVFAGLTHGGLTMASSESSRYYLENGLFIERGEDDERIIVLVDPMLTQITIPLDVTSIGEGAFYCLSNEVTSGLTIPGNVREIGDHAFQSCKISGPLSLTEGLVSIGYGAFEYSEGLTGDVTIPSTVTSIGTYAFSECEGLTGVVISEGVTGIPNNMFNGCLNITSLTIPSTVTTIGSSAFRGCSSIASELYLPENLTSLGGSAFANCSSMTGTVIIPSYITSISYGVFSGCSSLTGTLEIPSTVTIIGSNAFDGCSGITSVVIRGGSNYIDSYAFANMTGVTGTLEIPASIGCIYESAFERSTFMGFSVAQGGSGGGNYYKYTVEGELLIQNYTTGSGDNTNVTRTVMAYPTGLSSDSVIIPEDVVRIGDGAFAGAEGMTGELIIPVSVVNIGYRAFADCTGIDVLKIPGRTWNSVANDAFFNINIAQDVEGTITPMEHTSGDSSIETVFNASMFTRSETPINNTWYTYDSLYYVITMDEDGRLVYGDYDYNILNSYRYFTEIEYDGKKYYSGETEWTWKTSDGNGTITAVNVGSTWSQDRVLHVVGDTGNEPLDRAKLTGFVYNDDVYSNSYWLRSQILHEVSGTIESGKQEYSISSDDMQVVFEVSSDDRYVGTIDADAGTFSVMVPDGLGGELVIEPLNRFLMTVSATGADAEVHSIQTVTSDTDGLGFIVTPWTFILEFNPGNPTVEPTVITMDDGSPAFTTDGDTSIPVTYTQTFVYGAGGEIMPSKFLREGWGQNGWRTDDYGDSASHGWVANDGDTVDDQFYYEIDDDGDTVKVYALWVLWDSVTYERNGSFVDKEYYAPGVIVTLPSIASKVGYKDLDVTAWTETTEDQVHVTVADGRFQMPDHSVVFSVEDVPIDYTVNYDLGGGIATGAQPTTWKYSEWQTVHPATKDGYSFLGWTLSGDDADLGETEYRDGSGANWNLGLIPGELIKNSDMEGSKLVDISNMSVTDGGVVTLTASWGPIKYQVDYDLDGGTEGNLSPGEWLYGIAQSVDDPSKTGYTFVGWMVSGALNDAAISGDVLDQQSTTLVDGSAIGTNVPVIGSNGSVYMQDLCVNEGEVVTLTATWRPNTYTIEFIAGHEDATGSMEPMDMEYDTPAVLTPLGFTVAGHVFAGWSVSGLNVPYQDGASVTNLTSVDNGTVQMTAIWNAITFTIRFDKNSESATGAMSDQDFIYGTEKDLTINGYENPGYALAGWAITSDGNVIYEDGATLSTQYDATGTYTLYAVWEPVEYVIALDNGPGTGGPDGLTVTYLSTGTEYTIGGAPMEFTAPVREGYTFGGYFSDVTKVVASDGTLVRDAVGFTTSEGYWDRIVPTGETLELVAGWIPNQYDITVDSAGGVNGSTKVTATYNQTLPEFIAPSYEGYYLMGYYIQDGNDTMLIDAGGDLVANISGYTDSNGCWIRLDGASVVARWTDGATVTVNDGRAVPGTVPFGILTSSESIGLVRDGYTIDDVTSVEMGGQDLTEDQDWSFSDGELTIDSGIDVTDNIVVSAIWTVNTLTVTTNVDGTKADTGWSIIVVDDGGASLTPTSVEDGELTFSEVVLGKTYNIFYGDVETGESITIEGKDSDLTIDFYTVSYDVIDEGVSSESIVTAAVGEMPISSGTTVPGGTTVSFTAVGHGAVGAGCTYTYSWAPMGTNNVSVDHEVVTKVDVTCTVTGSDGRVPITVDLVVDGASPASMDPIDVIVRPVSGTDAILSMTSGTVSGDVAPGQYVVYLGSVDDPVAKADMPVGRTAIPESSVHGHALLEVFSVTIDGEGIEPVDVQYVGKGLTYSSVIIAEEGYRLPDSISGTMADAELATGQYAYDVDGALSVDVFGKVVIDVDAIRVWNVTVVVDPLEGATVNTPTVVDDGADLNLTITSTSDNNERYRLPDDIEVRIGGNVLPATGYTYDPTTGEVSVPDIYGDVVVTVDPVLQYMLDLSSLQTQGVVGYMYRIGDGMFMDYDGPVWIDAGSDLYILGREFGTLTN
ncbi:MAG: leucine-rich repeat protein [Candidatus Methanomethylophilaceae archaeon]|nr:leucine-rich repeat protein [Candidatus Methanomethylophilaceae archaeon]